jgi:hypothetical protein
MKKQIFEFFEKNAVAYKFGWQKIFAKHILIMTRLLH